LLPEGSHSPCFGRAFFWIKKMIDYKNTTERVPFRRQFTRGQVICFYSFVYFFTVLPVVDALVGLLMGVL